jgi:hypothetical protein
MLASSIFIEVIRTPTLPYSDPLDVFCRALKQAGHTRWLRWFACWCAWRAAALTGDSQCIPELRVAQRFARGRATEEELSKAHEAVTLAVNEAEEADEAAYQAICSVEYATSPGADEYVIRMAAVCLYCTQACGSVAGKELGYSVLDEEREREVIYRMMIRIIKKIEKGIHQ